MPYNVGLEKSFGFRVTPKYRQHLETLAELEDVSISRIIRKALVEYAERRSRRGRRLANISDAALKTWPEERKGWSDLIRQNKKGYCMVHLYRELANSLNIDS